jgi:pimeloyl-ACP methyl ester carboxylesterase
MRGETRELNNETRKSASGAFIQTAAGYTHYELGGNEQGEIVVLIHGFSVPYFIYDPTFEFLTQSGFYVLRYDLFGRGFSDRPRVNYNLDLFVTQLRDLLDALRFTPPVSLIGLSMGGIIASAFASRHPSRVRTVTLIDPAGAKALSLSPILKAAKMPFVAEAIVSVAGTEFLIQSMAKDLFDPKLVEHFIAQYRIQMAYKGFVNAILSSMRNGMLDSFEHVYQALGKLEKDVLLFWGRNDETVPFEHSKILTELLPRAQLHVIENCGHVPHYEKPDEVNPILLNFLRQI